MNTVIGEYQNNHIRIIYIQNAKGNAGMVLLPSSFDREINITEQHVDPLVHVCLRGDAARIGFANGSTMRDTSTTEELNYSHQDVLKTNDYTLVSTVLQHDSGIKIIHKLKLFNAIEAVECWAEAIIDKDNNFLIEMITSFSLNTYLFENAKDDEIKLHRLLSYWSSEGRKLSQTMEELNFERSWSGHGVRSLKYGAVGSLPVKEYFPFGAVQDVKNGICWGAMLAVPYSWQMEITRYGDELCFSGGIADRDFGHFEKELKAQDKFITPKAILSTVLGDEEDVLRSINHYLDKNIKFIPEPEKNVPVVFNEFCTTWGNPSFENIKAIAEKIKNLGFGYFVIDAGWYQTADGNWCNNIGDWRVSEKLFPNGLKEAADYIRGCNMIPGLWFELENVGIDAKAAIVLDEWLLKKDGYTIKSGQRRFWDMQNPNVQNYLRERVINTLKQNGFGYIKIDYNESIGIGCDGSESLGEGLRKNILAAQDFFNELHETIPGIVIENCASGGHRSEPSMLMISSMNSFSDAHECLSIPIIAANVGRVVPARQNQIWCVLRRTDSVQRLCYSLAAAFFGRMCISGDIHEVDGDQINILKNALAFYRKISHIIVSGKQYIYRTEEGSYNNPKGSQVIIRRSNKENSILAIGHSFDVPESIQIDMPANARIEEIFGESSFEINNGKLEYIPTTSYSGGAVLITYQ